MAGLKASGCSPGGTGSQQVMLQVRFAEVNRAAMTEAFDVMLPKFLEFHAANGYELIIAQHYAWMGDRDKAFEWLDKHDREMTWGVRDHLTRPWYRKLHDDPRWEQYRMKVGVPTELVESLEFSIELPD